jgi:hypothetical protein
MFNLAMLVSLFGALPIITAWVFVKTARDDLESPKKLLATAVEVEKIQTAWRARNQTLDREL